MGRFKITMIPRPNIWKSMRKSAIKRGYDYRWQKARLSFLKANPLCVKCVKNGLTTMATVVDHIIPHKGDKRLFWDVNNWQGLCEHCHNSEKQKEENKAGYHGQKRATKNTIKGT